MKIEREHIIGAVIIITALFICNLNAATIFEWSLNPHTGKLDKVGILGNSTSVNNAVNNALAGKQNKFANATTLARFGAGPTYNGQAIGGGGGVTDHGNLSGLSDNDHPQYLLQSRQTAYSTARQAEISARYKRNDSPTFTNTTTVNLRVTGTLTAENGVTVPQGASASAIDLFEGTGNGGLYKAVLTTGDLSTDTTYSFRDWLWIGSQKVPTRAEFTNMSGIVAGLSSGGVSSFAGRTGAVSPAFKDYSTHYQTKMHVLREDSITVPMTNAVIATTTVGGVVAGEIYAGVQNEVTGVSTSRIYKSTDNGINWTLLKTFNNSWRVDGMFIDSQGYVYASPFGPIGSNVGSADAGLWRSTDGGTNWTRVIDLPTLFATTHNGYAIGRGMSLLAVAEDTTLRNTETYKWLYATLYTDTSHADYFTVRIYRSKDAGATWTAVYTGSTTDYIHMHQIHVDGNNNVYALPDKYAAYGPPYNPTTTNSILKSTNGGDTWTGIGSTSLPQFTALESGSGFRVFGTDDPDELAVYRTTDDSTFTKVFSQPLVTDNTKYPVVMRRNPSSGHIFFGVWGAGEVYASFDDGVTWQVIKQINPDYTYGNQTGFWGASNFYNNKLLLGYHYSFGNDTDFYSVDTIWENGMVLEDGITDSVAIIVNPKNTGVSNGSQHTHQFGDGDPIDLTTTAATGTLPIASGGTGQTTAQTAINALTAVSSATNEHILTKDTATGNAIWKANGATGSPGGSTTQIQFNDSGSFAGDAALVWDKTNDLLSLGAAGDPTIVSRMYTTTNSNTVNGIHDMYYDGVNNPAVTFRKARGTKSSPSSAQQDDGAGGLAAMVYDSSGTPGFRYVGAFKFYAETTPVSATNHPGYFVLSLADSDDAVFSEKLRVSSNGNTTAQGTVSGTQLISTVATGTAPITVTSTTESTNLHAATATTLHTARTIAGQSFNGSANIDIPYTSLSSAPTAGSIIYSSGGALTAAHDNLHFDNASGSTQLELTTNGTYAAPQISLKPASAANTAYGYLASRTVRNVQLGAGVYYNGSAFYSPDANSAGVANLDMNGVDLTYRTGTSGSSAGTVTMATRFVIHNDGNVELQGNMHQMSGQKTLTDATNTNFILVTLASNTGTGLFCDYTIKVGEGGANVGYHSGKVICNLYNDAGTMATGSACYNAEANEAITANLKGTATASTGEIWTTTNSSGSALIGVNSNFTNGITTVMRYNCTALDNVTLTPQ